MAKKRYRNKRHGSRLSKISIYVKIFGVGVMILAFVSLVAYSACAKINDSEKDYESINLEELTEVITPGLDDGLLLEYPGYKVFFSNIHHQPYYSTWILTPEHVRNTEFSRSNSFRADPDVENSAQLSDYKYSGYDRGHIAPSADFRYSQEAQDASFFLTNMSPQLSSLNSGAWNNLEEQCRKWALRDSTLVIVAGPVLSDYLTESIGESHVTIPDRFFKVVYAPFANPPRAIGFVMPNQYVQGGVQATAMSVDNVEAITGYDFFSALPDELEADVESSANYHIWQNTR